MSQFGQPVEASADIQPSTIDWGALREQAMALPEETAENASTPPPAEAAPEPVADVAAAPETEPVQPPKTGNEIPDDHIVRVKIDGKEQDVPYKQFKDALQREAAFYQRTQQLAQQRRQAEQELAQQFQQIQQAAQALEMYKQQVQNDPLRQLLQQQMQQMQQKAKDPNEIATVGEVEQKLQQVQQEYANALRAKDVQYQQALQQTMEQLRSQQIVEQDARIFGNALNEVMNSDDFKIVKELNPFAEQILRFQTAQADHETIQDAVAYMKGLAQTWAGQFKQVTQAQKQQEAVAAAKVKMESGKGSPAPPRSGSAKPGSFFGKDGKLDWNALRERSMALMDE